MNIIALRQEKRKNQINSVVATLKKTFDAGLDVDKQTLILQLCKEFSVSKRTAMEYLDVALLSLNTEEVKHEGRVLICKKKEDPK